MILVTGASGFIGRAAGRHLTSLGHQVRGVVRRPDVSCGEGVEPTILPDLLDGEKLRAAMAGVTQVVHAAAHVHVRWEPGSGALDAFRRANVDVTRALLDAASTAGVQRFVFLSSVKAVGEASTSPLTEDMTLNPKSSYGISKLEAERLVAASAVSAGMDYCILRLPLVYGPEFARTFYS